VRNIRIPLTTLKTYNKSKQLSTYSASPVIAAIGCDAEHWVERIPARSFRRDA
jgi:hypothetical protein